MAGEIPEYAYPLRLEPGARADWRALDQEAKQIVRVLFNQLMNGRAQSDSKSYFADEEGRPTRYVQRPGYAVVYRMGTSDIIERMQEVVIVAVGTTESLLIPDPDEEF